MDAGAMFLGAGEFTKLKVVRPSQLIIHLYLVILKALHLVAAALPPDGRSILYPGRCGWPS
jgi:hypothetical protein